MTSVDPLLNARALVLRDLAAQGLIDPHTVSVVEDCVSQRRWWLSQWQLTRESRGRDEFWTQEGA